MIMAQRAMIPPAAQASLLARWEAKRRVKKEWMSKGMKLSAFSGSEITQAANAYMLAHP
jgi:hypothetical protein